MAQNSYAQVAGRIVALNGDTGPFRTCRHCGCTTGRVGAGADPHAASLVCTGCDRHIAWLSEASLRALAAVSGKRGAA